MMKILIAEDNSKHQRDVRAFFKTIPEVEAIFTWSLEGTLDKMSGVDGILCDIYLPLMDNRRGGDAEHPMGVAVALLAAERKIPCVMVTGGYHHGSKYQEVHEFQRQRKLSPMVDSSNGETEAESKNWAEGFKALQALMGGGVS